LPQRCLCLGEPKCHLHGLVKKAGLKDLWGPHSRFKAYEEIIQVVDDMAAVRGLAQAQVAILKEGIASKLRVKVNQGGKRQS
jgi:hypothetical protein